MKFADLDRAARMAAAQAPVEWRADVYQDAWVRFLHYVPLTFWGARLMAQHAMLDLMKRESYRYHRQLTNDIIEEVAPPDNLLSELRRICPEETAELLLYYKTDHPTGAERIHAMRQRRKIKRKITHPKPTRKEGQKMYGPNDPKPEPAPDEPQPVPDEPTPE